MTSSVYHHLWFFNLLNRNPCRNQQVQQQGLTEQTHLYVSAHQRTLPNKINSNHVFRIHLPCVQKQSYLTKYHKDKTDHGYERADAADKRLTENHATTSGNPVCQYVTCSTALLKYKAIYTINGENSPLSACRQVEGLNHRSEAGVSRPAPIFRELTGGGCKPKRMENLCAHQHKHVRPKQEHTHKRVLLS